MVLVKPPEKPGVDLTPEDRRSLAAAAETAGNFLGGRRRTLLPLADECRVSKLAENFGEKRAEFTVLEHIVQSTILDLHDVERSLKYWKSKAKGTQHRKMYFLALERGPRAFAEIACQAVLEVRNPSKFLEDSATHVNHMVAVRMQSLVSIQRCLANFLTQVFIEVQASKEGLDELSTNPLRTLFTVVDTLFQNLGLALNIVVDKGPEFERIDLLEAGIAKWTVESSIDAVNLIYRNIKRLNEAVSSELELHGKPRNLTRYWFPYTCGTVAFVGCSIFLLRNSLEGGSGIDTWFQGSKEILTQLFKAHLEKPIISIRDELVDTFNGDDHLEERRREVQLLENSVHRSCEILFKNSSDLKDLSDGELWKQLIKSRENQVLGAGSSWDLINSYKMLSDPDLYRSLLIKLDIHTLGLDRELLGISEKLKRMGLNFAILEALPTVGFLAGLIWLFRVHGRSALNARKIATRLLVASIEKDAIEFTKLIGNGLEDDAYCQFGMLVYQLDNLCATIEPHARRSEEWECIRDDLLNLARPSLTSDERSHTSLTSDERSHILSRLKWTYLSTRVF